MCAMNVNLDEVHIQLICSDDKHIYNNVKEENKKKLKEIIKRVYIGNSEDSKNALLLNNTHITRNKIYNKYMYIYIFIYIYVHIF